MKEKHIDSQVVQDMTTLATLNKSTVDMETSLI